MTKGNGSGEKQKPQKPLGYGHDKKSGGKGQMTEQESGGITFTLDGREVIAHDDESIWQVAQRLGVAVLSSFTGSMLWQAAIGYPMATPEEVGVGLQDFARIWNQILDACRDNPIPQRLASSARSTSSGACSRTRANIEARSGADIAGTIHRSPSASSSGGMEATMECSISRSAASG